MSSRDLRSTASGPLPAANHEALQDLLRRVRELEAALHPFAAYAYAMTAYGLLHRGTFPPDNKSMAYVQTECGESGNITWGDFKFAQEVMPKARYGGESTHHRRRALIAEQAAGSAGERLAAGSHPGSSPQPREDQ